MTVKERMQLRPLLLVCVAVVSAIISGFHLYLVSSRGQRYISVALEIPVESRTNLELNIQSVQEIGNQLVGGEVLEHKDGESGIVSHSNVEEVPKDLNLSLVVNNGTNIELGILEEEEEVGKLEEGDEEEYEVLLDTGEYELEEKDMDKEEEEERESVAPQTQREKRRYKKKRGDHTTARLPAITQPTVLATTVGNTELLVRERTMEREGEKRESVAPQTQREKRRYKKKRGDHTTARLPAVTQPTVLATTVGNTELLVRERTMEREGEVERATAGIVKNRGPHVVSKEDYYVKHATSTYQPPTTHTHHHHHNITRTPSQCSHPPCLQYLSAQERYIFNKCQKRTITKVSHGVPACKCRFRNGVGKKRAAIVSLPGSGNTWIRGLLEKASGLCTGSIYCDRSLREGGFCGEGLRGSNLLAVKTHESSVQWRGGRKIDTSKPVFDKVIFLIRNPFKANIAEWNRQISKKYASDQTGSSHVKYVSNEAFFGRQAGWQALVKYQTHKWRIMLGSNLRAQAAGRPVLIVFFEDLKAGPAPQLARMMDFLELPLSPAAINATIMDGFTSYYRNHTDHYDHYTQEQRLLVNSVITSTADTLQDKVAKRIRQYLHH